MSSHREAPAISQDPVADSTDLYAFVTPDGKNNSVTLIANYIPLEPPASGPNFFEFGTDVQYQINIDNNGDGVADVTYTFMFTTTILNPNTFLYNIGPITSPTDTNWNRQQTYSVSRSVGNKTTVLATGLSCPPCNIGPLSTPNYATKLAGPAIHSIAGGRTVFAGQRAEGFYVDLGAVFDLGDLRMFEALHTPVGTLKDKPGVNATAKVNVHSIALQVPISDLVASNPVIGVWTTAGRQKVKIYDQPTGTMSVETVNSGPYVQVSRLGNPLFNEVLVPMAQKDYWNTQTPADDSQFANGVQHPELAGLLNVLYPGVFPLLAAYTKARADLQAILLTGIPPGVVSPTYTTFTGTTLADMLRLNTSIPATTSDPSPLGVLGGDLAGFPNGRRVFDDVFTIELRAIAGFTIGLVDPSWVAEGGPDGAAKVVTDSLTTPTNYLPGFPYLGTPYSGYDVPSS